MTCNGEYPAASLNSTVPLLAEAGMLSGSRKRTVRGLWEAVATEDRLYSQYDACVCLSVFVLHSVA
jgi:hypothetical protein